MNMKGYWVICSEAVDDTGRVFYQARCTKFPDIEIDADERETAFDEFETSLREALIAMQESGHEFPPFDEHNSQPAEPHQGKTVKYIIVEN